MAKGMGAALMVDGIESALTVKGIEAATMSNMGGALRLSSKARQVQS